MPGVLPGVPGCGPAPGRDGAALAPLLVAASRAATPAAPKRNTIGPTAMTDTSYDFMSSGADSAIGQLIVALLGIVLDDGRGLGVTHRPQGGRH